jgi:hypothetical protein
MSSLSSKEALLETPLRITSLGHAIQFGKEEFIRYYVQQQSGLIGHLTHDRSDCASVNICEISMHESNEMGSGRRYKKQRGEPIELEPQRFTARPINFHAINRYAKRLSVGKINVAQSHRQ